MRQRLYHRLEHLEQEHAQLLESLKLRERQADHDPIKKTELFLQLCGTEAGRNESLAEATARAIGITYRELIAQVNAGIDPIHKYLTDQGVFEEIERRKAAGTWPSG